MAKSTVSPETEVINRAELTPLYRVVLLDDDDHTYDYVIEMLQKIFIFSLDQAYRHAEEVDTCGRTILITCELPEAEFIDNLRMLGGTPTELLEHEEILQLMLPTLRADFGAAETYHGPLIPGDPPDHGEEQEADDRGHDPCYGRELPAHLVGDPVGTA